MSKAGRLVDRLVDVGYSEAFIRASMPDWWTPEQEKSTSGKTLVSLLLARRLGLDPVSLLDDNVPVGFLHTGPTKFKHLRIGPGLQREALAAYSQGVARLVLAAQQPAHQPMQVRTASELRQELLASGRDHVGFGDVLALCWALNIPVLHLGMFPAATKGITAMAVRVGQRHVILVARESGVEAQYMFHIAHELGHISLGHLQNTVAIIDAETEESDAGKSQVAMQRMPSAIPSSVDEEELAADQFAQELLTGNKNFKVERAVLESGPGGGTPSELAERAIAAGTSMGVDPGHIIMCFGYTTRDWALAQSAVKLLPQQDDRPGSMVNKVLWSQIEDISDAQSAAFLRAVTAA